MILFRNNRNKQKEIWKSRGAGGSEAVLAKTQCTLLWSV